MEDLIPPVLIAVREIRWRMASGRSMKESLKYYLEENSSRLSMTLREWSALKAQGRDVTKLSRSFTSHYQTALVTLIERGLQGQPVLEPLQSLENEVESAANAELEAHLQVLPFKVLIPLLLFQFPAFLILLLGPLLRELSQQLGSG